MGPFANRYLLTAAGRDLSSRWRQAVPLFASIVGGPLLMLAGFAAEVIFDAGAAIFVILSGVFLFIGGIVYAWVLLLGGAKDVANAAQHWLYGDPTAAVALCQKTLGRVYRADIRTRALYTLGLCAEATADFREAEDLFARSEAALPAMVAPRWKQHLRMQSHCHRAVALVALGDLDRADALVRQAANLFLPPKLGVLDALTDDVHTGGIGMAVALRDVEPGRDPRALLTLASVVVLAARGLGREALELLERERPALRVGLLPREHALLEHAEVRARQTLPGGAFRGAEPSPRLTAGHGGHGLAPGNGAGGELAWESRILPVHR